MRGDAEAFVWSRGPVWGGATLSPLIGVNREIEDFRGGAGPSWSSSSQEGGLEKLRLAVSDFYSFSPVTLFLFHPIFISLGKARSSQAPCCPLCTELTSRMADEEHHETFEAAGAGASKTFPYVWASKRC